jgi:hypothetical protein
MQILKSKGHIMELILVSIRIQFELGLAHYIHWVRCWVLIQKLTGIVWYVRHHHKWTVIQCICP